MPPKRFITSTYIWRKLCFITGCGFLLMLVFLIMPFLRSSNEENHTDDMVSYRFERKKEHHRRYLYKDVKTLLAEFHGDSPAVEAESQNGKTQDLLVNSLKKREQDLIKELQKFKNLENTENKQADYRIQNILEGLANSVRILTSKVDKLSRFILSKREEKAEITNLKDIRKCKNPTVLFLVTSHSSNIKRRQSIRETWGNQAQYFHVFKEKYNLTYEVYFNVGTGKDEKTVNRMKEESRQYGDVLIVNREEDFYDLTRRVMATFKWSAQNCNYTYLFKMDDDIFINIPNALSFLSNNTFTYSRAGIYAGDMNRNAHVNRDERSKYLVSYDEWPAETYPPYCSGGGFALSHTVVQQIIPFFDWINPYKIDDAYVGILIERAKIRDLVYYEPTKNQTYQFWFYNKPNNCTYIDSSIVYHKVSTHACMKNLTLQSKNNIKPSLKTIQHYKRQPPPLWMLGKASVPGHQYLPKVHMVY